MCIALHFPGVDLLQVDLLNKPLLNTRYIAVASTIVADVTDLDTYHLQLLRFRLVYCIICGCGACYALLISPSLLGMSCVV
jgi:hypothetical protein